MSTHEKQIPICHVGGSAADSEMNTRIESFELAYRMKPLTRPVSLYTAPRTLALLLALTLTGFAAEEDAASLRQKGIQIIPRPSHIEAQEGHFTLTPHTVIQLAPGTESIGATLAKHLRPATGFPLPFAGTSSVTKAPESVIELRLSDAPPQTGDEGYFLQVRSNHILLRAAKPAGLFYGCQTLRQLFPPAIEASARVAHAAWTAPAVTIEDTPQFVWRGVLLDPARQFISKQGLYKAIDWMAYHKLNRLHLHLTDVDGWRLEIKKYPRLTQVGAWARLDGGLKIGGYYTQKDIRDIVAYANERFVMLIPEIEMPSHAGAALVAYPELNCFGTRTSIAQFPVDPLCGSEFCPGNDDVLEFIDGVLSEVAALFPGPIIHIGGDEAEMRYWGECPKCQARQKKVGNLHDWFMDQVRDKLAAKGKRAMGWSGVTKGAVFTCWDNDGSGGWGAAKGGWDVVMATGNHHYLNYNIERTTLKTAYDFDPAPARAALSPEARRHILGFEACLWGEMIPENHLESQAFPRIVALAERGWGVERPDFEDFTERLKIHVERLAQMGILTGPAYGYPIQTALPGRIRNAMPSLIYSASQNQNDEDWRWTLTGIDRGQGYDAILPAQGFDGDLETFHMSWGPRKDVDTFTVVLNKPDTFDRVKAITGMANGDHILREGVLEVSTGYGRWKEVARFKKGVAETKLDRSKIVSVRIRSTINQPPNALLAIREIILEKNGQSTLKTLSPVDRLHLPAAASQ